VAATNATDDYIFNDNVKLEKYYKL